MSAAHARQKHERDAARALKPEGFRPVGRDSGTGKLRFRDKDGRELTVPHSATPGWSAARAVTEARRLKREQPGEQKAVVHRIRRETRAERTTRERREKYGFTLEQMQYVGRKVAALRESVGMRQADLCEFLIRPDGVHFSTGVVSYIEQGIGVPSRELIEEYSRIFDVSISSLLPDSVHIGQFPPARLAKPTTQRRDGAAARGASAHPPAKPVLTVRSRPEPPAPEPEPEPVAAAEPPPEPEPEVQPPTEAERERLFKGLDRKGGTTPDDAPSIRHVLFLDDGSGEARRNATTRVHLRLVDGRLTITWPNGASTETTAFDGDIYLKEAE